MASDSERTGKCLLIVDDEEMLVELLRRMVTRNGYRALVATTAADALSLFEANRSEIDLVITDLVMPGMDGKALAEDLLRRYPETRILVSTGFRAAADITELLARGVRGVVMKPYQSDQLFAMIHDALNGVAN